MQNLENTLLKDSSGRQMRKLRISLLDACNFRCFYCMPLDAKFMPSSKLLSVDEIEFVSSILVESGIEEIRITGGEPTLRKDFQTIVSRLSKLPLKKLGMTTNGFRLKDEIAFLKTTHCHHINVSLDSLERDTFNRITHSTSFDDVMAGILSAQENGFNIKINMIIMRGINDHEIYNFIDFSAKTKIEIRFLELMKIGEACGKQNNLFISADEILQKIRLRDRLNIVTTMHDSTSFNFITDQGAQIGFIASESKPFCGACSRWRLSADGFLRACLMSQAGLSIRNLSREQIVSLFPEILRMKPTGRIKDIAQNMNQIGG